ncbi:MAG TPA: hypothetical protein VMW30_03365 [Candidatus Paceibacterota bacterium]|nr:hypothetical protein [Candidatus Paceibacterota bacterium]
MRNSRNIFARTLILVILINALTIPPTYAGPRRELVRLFMAGRVSTAVPNTILNGITPPRSSIGINGDFYIDMKALVLYGPKSKSRWLNPISLRGPQGTPGAKGANGTNGVDGKNSTSVGQIGPQGIAGPIGPRGEAGIAGAAGPAGAGGAMGPMGPAGAAGSPGANGTVGPAGPAGAQGSPGANGAPGSAGASGGIGLAGATGATGATGAAGPSRVYVISIPAWTLSTATGGTSADSLSFGTLAAQNSYHYSIILHGVTPVTNAYFGLSMKVGPLATTTLYESAITENRAYIGAAFVHRYTFIIQGTIVVGSSDTWLKVSVTDGAGVTSGVDSMSISGQAIFQQVGQVN